MDGKELKTHLEELIAQGKADELTDLELSFVQGQIHYPEYLNRCYAEYLTVTPVDTKQLLPA